MKRSPEASETKGISVGEFYKQISSILDIELVSGGRGKNKRVILDPSPQRLGLALTGYTSYLSKGRIGIFGKTEKLYFDELKRDRKEKVFEDIVKSDLACIVFTRGYRPPRFVRRLSVLHEMPVLVTPLDTSVFIEDSIEVLLDNLSQTTVVHGSLVDVHGVGVLVTGRSGIGKSESVVELISRGHRLVSDDAVFVQKWPPEILYGKSAGITRDFVEVRGLGILNIRELFGVSSVLDRKRIDLVVELVDWDKMERIDRLGEEESHLEILGVKLPLVRIPVSPGRNVSILLEVAALNYMLKKRGYNSIEAIERDFAKAISNKKI